MWKRKVLKYIVVRDGDDAEIVFCGFDHKTGCIIASETSYKDAMLFRNEDRANEYAYKLNARKYGSGGWYARPYYVWEVN